jgi:hypothetical protein
MARIILTNQPLKYFDLQNEDTPISFDFRNATDPQNEAPQNLKLA